MLYKEILNDGGIFCSLETVKFEARWEQNFHTESKEKKFFMHGWLKFIDPVDRGHQLEENTA